MPKDHSQSAMGICSKCAAQHHSRVIHQDINAAHSAQSGFAQVLDIGVPGNVAMHGENTPPEIGDVGTRLLKPTVVNIGDDEIRPATGHGQRGASANPTGATSDDRDFPCALHSASLLCFLSYGHAATTGSTSRASSSSASKSVWSLCWNITRSTPSSASAWS